MVIPMIFVKQPKSCNRFECGKLAKRPPPGYETVQDHGNSPRRYETMPGRDFPSPGFNDFIGPQYKTSPKSE